MKIKGAEATLAKPAAELMSEEFDFPFRKGIPIGTMNIKATLSSSIGVDRRNFFGAWLFVS